MKKLLPAVKAVIKKDDKFLVIKQELKSGGILGLTGWAD